MGRTRRVRPVFLGGTEGERASAGMPYNFYLTV